MAPTLVIVPPGGLKGWDIQLLELALKTEMEQRTIQDILNEHEDGTCQIWRFESPEGYGIGLTEKKGNELFVHYVSGKGVLPYIEKIVDAMGAWGKGVGCVALTSRSNPGMVRVLQKRCGFRPLWTDMRKEL